MSTISIIARLTFREAIRRKIVMAALMLGGIFLVVYGLGFYFITEEIQRELRLEGVSANAVSTNAYNFLVLAGFYVVNFLGIATAALITSDSLAGEISTGTIQALVTKPVLRQQIVLGKWLGSAFLLLLYNLLMGGGILLLVWLIVGYQAPNWLGGLALLFLNTLLIMTLTLAFSSSLSTLATGGAVFGAFGIAFIGGWIERIGAVLNNQTAVEIGIISSLLLPSETIWNRASSLISSPLIRGFGDNPFSSSLQPSPLMMVYAVLYLLVILAFAIRRFHQRDL